MSQRGVCGIFVLCRPTIVAVEGNLMFWAQVDLGKFVPIVSCGCVILCRILNCTYTHGEPLLCGLIARLFVESMSENIE